MAQSTSDSPLSPDVTIDLCRGLEIKLPARKWQKLREAEWFNATRQAMAALPWDTDNWTTGGTRTQLSAVASMLTILINVLDTHTPPPTIAPTWIGGVQAEWHRNGVDFEIEATPQGQVEYFFKSPTEEREGRVSDDISLLVQYARAVITRE